MRKFFSIFVVAILCGNLYNVRAEEKPLYLQGLTQEQVLQVESDIDVLSSCNIVPSTIKKVNVTEDGNEYILCYNNSIEEKVIITDNSNGNVTIVVSDGKRRNEISYLNDGSIIIDGNKIEVEKSLSGPIYESTKSLYPYGNFTESDYNHYLTSGKQDIRLGKTLDAVTCTGLVTFLLKFTPYMGIVESIVEVAGYVYDILVALNPGTEYLGCKWTTYTTGPTSFDYKYINNLYPNRDCTGESVQEITYEHFTVY